MYRKGPPAGSRWGKQIYTYSRQHTKIEFIWTVNFQLKKKQIAFHAPTEARDFKSKFWIYWNGRRPVDLTKETPNKKFVCKQKHVTLTYHVVPSSRVHDLQACSHSEYGRATGEVNDTNSRLLVTAHGHLFRVTFKRVTLLSLERY